MDKRKSVTEIVSEYSIPFGIVQDGAVGHVVLLLPYAPYRDYGAEYLKLDAFYPASNRLYRIAGQIRSRLQSEGYETRETAESFKLLGERCGLGKILNNQLLANDRYGTKFALQGITVVGAHTHDGGLVCHADCAHCGACARACPGGALVEGAFYRERCLRQWQEEPFESPLSENLFLGCSYCQRACPKNAAIAQTDCPQEILQLLKIERLLENLLQGKKALEPLAETIGYNYARPSWLFALTLRVLKATENHAYDGLVARFSAHPNEAVRALVRLYLTKTDTNA